MSIAWEYLPEPELTGAVTKIGSGSMGRTNYFESMNLIIQIHNFEVYRIQVHELEFSEFGFRNLNGLINQLQGMIR